MRSATLSIEVPHVYQLAPVAGLSRRELLYGCGPACAAMAAAYLARGAPAFERAVLAAGGRAIAGRGTMPWQVADTVRLLAPGAAAGAAAAPTLDAARGLLQMALGRGMPLIALVRPSWVRTSINHYVLVAGLEGATGRVLLDDPLFPGPVSVPEGDFLAAWRGVRGIRPLSYVWAR